MSTSHARARSAYLRPSNVGCVFLGGTLGVLAREMLMLAVPQSGEVPIAVLIANVVGAFLLGVLLEASGALGSEAPRRQSLRLLVGTGMLGGFTTYSALAQAVLVLWVDGDAWLALVYGGGTLLLGGIATWGGMWLGGVLASRRGRGGERGRGDHG